LPQLFVTDKIPALEAIEHQAPPQRLRIREKILTLIRVTKKMRDHRRRAYLNLVNLLGLLSSKKRKASRLLSSGGLLWQQGPITNPTTGRLLYDLG
jgi:hypothetical protein